MLPGPAGLAMGAFLLVAGHASAQTCPEPGEVPRTVLALYDGARMSAPRYTPIHRFAELPLNHLGYRLVYRDVSRGPPDLPDAPLAAAISWFDAPLSDAAGYAAWRAALADICGRGPASIVLGHTGLTEAASLTEPGAAYLSRLGLAFAPGEVAVGAFSEPVTTQSPLLEFETGYDIAPGAYARLSAAPGAAAPLGVRSGETVIDLVVLGPGAAYAHESALIRGDPRGGPLWSIDPFGLFEHALGPRDWPVPDITTVSGRRALFVTVDSEGWLMPLPARQIGERPPLASEVLESQIITPFPDLPFSVAMLAGDLDDEIAGEEAMRGREVARYLLSLPNVDAATSGLTMILDWEFFAEYDPEAEAATLASGAPSRRGGLIPSAMETLGDAFSEETLTALDITPDARRKYASLPFDLAAETAGSAARLAALAPPGRAPALFVWSGNALPFPGAIAATGDAGLGNMGGGGGLATASAPSLAGLWPASIDTEGGLQVYDALSGDARYTDFWTGNLAGYQALDQTLARTETPRRLKPVQVHFAARSALSFAARSAVLRNLETARAADLAPIRAARYASWVSGARTARLFAEEGGVWRIEDRGGLQTLRLDNARDRVLDLGRSTGVLGVRRQGDRLYLALDPDTPAPRIAFAAGRDPGGVTGQGTTPLLVEARAEILGADRRACALALTLLGYGETETLWQGAPGARYEVTLFEPGGQTRRFWQDMEAGPDGRFSLTLPLPPGQPAGLSVTAPCP